MNRRKSLFTEPSPHELIVAAERRRREQVGFNASARYAEPIPIDPSAGDVRMTFYETMRARGD